ncbi:MAG: DNA-directed RNA polymerase subunit N [Thermoplasmata archaeon]|nr:DNA-directed RNA polymerase subunit N [Thermoplasmata archaeon]
MIIPVRCFTCGKVIGQLYDEFNLRVQGGEDAKKVLDELGLERYCCRRMFLTHVDLIDQIMPYS